MKAILDKLFQFQKLTREEARKLLINLARGSYNALQVAAFLSTYRMRTITLDELMGFREAMLELCLPLDFSEFNTIDLCGTGGDGKNTFNISTLASFVVAGAGEKVAKHGNYGVSSNCGSSNILEHFGYKFKNDESRLKKELDKAGICFLHAPQFHPAMKNVASIRKDLGIKTFFNILGPMVNPSQPKNQLIGVYNLELARAYHYLYQQLDKNYSIIHSLDGYDEISLTSPAKIYSSNGERMVDAAIFGLSPLRATEIVGGSDIEASAKIFLNILEGKGSEAQVSVVIANAALALQTFNPGSDLAINVERARIALEDGKALECFKRLMELNTN
jgi:anthranilate phosphoribosyltransferase